MIRHYRRKVSIAIRDPWSTLRLVLGLKKSLLEHQVSDFLGIDLSGLRELASEVQSDPPVRFPSQEENNVGQTAATFELYSAVRTLTPDIVVETGVAAGVSSAYILAALKRNGRGHLYSIDLPGYEEEYLPGLGIKPSAVLPPSRLPGYIVPHHLRDRWTLEIGKSQELLAPLMDRVDQIGMFFHDGEHTYENMLFEFNLAWKHLKSGGALLADNVSWNAALTDFARLVRSRPALFWLSDLGGLRKQ
jgi:predicted O-methyltransferase YrrM